MLERVIFYIFALIIFIMLFGRIIKRRDSIYVYLLAANAIGLLLRIIEMNNDMELSFALTILCYTISIIVPFIIIALEYRNIFLPEMYTIIRAKFLLKLGQNEAARKLLIKYIEKHSDSYFAHKLLAQIYEREGKYDSAIDEYVIVVDLNKKDYDSYYKIAFLLNQTEKSEEAKKMLEELLEKKPEYYQASDLLGSILYDQELFKEAVGVYLQALKYNPDKYELYYGLGMSYTRLNDFQAAKEYYDKAARLNSLLFHAKVNAAQIMLIEGELEEAEERLIECLEDKDSEPDAYFYLAIISMLKGEKDRAVGYVNIAIELDEKMYKRVCKQEIFKPIMDEVRANKTQRHKYHMNIQELKTRKHLDDTIALIQSLKSEAKSRANKADKKIIDIDRYEQREF